MLQDACENPAAAFGARGTPEVLRIVDILGILQSRRWGVCTLNEFRQVRRRRRGREMRRADGAQYFGLKRYASFEEWNPDPEIAVRRGLGVGELLRLTRSGGCVSVVRPYR